MKGRGWSMKKKKEGEEEAASSSAPLAMFKGRGWNMKKKKMKEGEKEEAASSAPLAPAALPVQPFAQPPQPVAVAARVAVAAPAHLGEQKSDDIQADVQPLAGVPLESPDDCGCWEKITIDGVRSVRSNDELNQFHICLCDSKVWLDAREFIFPGTTADNRIRLGFNGCCTDVKIVYAPEMQVTELSEYEWGSIKKRDLRPTEGGMLNYVTRTKKLVLPTKFIEVETGYWDCFNKIETIKLDHGQDMPSSCSIM